MADPTPRPERPRIFCVGLNKTGTSSFHEAMTILGFRSLHWGGPDTRRTVEAALAAGRLALDDLDSSYDAFSDIEPLYRNVELVDAQYPGSRFVLTIRPIEDWLESRRRHVERNRAKKAAGEYHGTFLEVDREGWTREWEDHVRRVRGHFAGRSGFLELDITSGEGWAPLCGLLSVPEPPVPFPWANRDRQRCD